MPGRKVERLFLEKKPGALGRSRWKKIPNLLLDKFESIRVNRFRRKWGKSVEPITLEKAYKELLQIKKKKGPIKERLRMEYFLQHFCGPKIQSLREWILMDLDQRNQLIEKWSKQSVGRRMLLSLALDAEEASEELAEASQNISKIAFSPKAIAEQGEMAAEVRHTMATPLVVTEMNLGLLSSQVIKKLGLNK